MELHVPTRGGHAEPVLKRAGWRKVAVLLALVMAFPAMFVGCSYHYDHNGSIFFGRAENTGTYDIPFGVVVATHPVMSAALPFAAWLVTPAETAKPKMDNLGRIQGANGNYRSETKAESLAHSKTRKREKLVYELTLFLVVVPGWFGEWFFYGWLLDMWNYHSRLDRSVVGMQPEKLEQPQAQTRGTLTERRHFAAPRFLNDGP